MGRKYDNDLQEYVSLKQLVEDYKMQGYIAEKHVEWRKQETFGKDAEKYIVETTKKYRPDVKITKTTKEYDYVYGADFKIEMGDLNCYFDLKTAMAKEVVKCNYFLDKNRTFNAKFNDIKFLRITPDGVKICLGIRYSKTIKQGRIIYSKPVLVPVIFGELSEDTITTKEFIDNFLFVIRIGMLYLNKRKYSKKIIRRFGFLPHDTEEDC